MSTHYCEIHASGRIYNPPLLILRSATPLVLQLAIFWLCALWPFPDLRTSAFPSLRTPVFSVLRSTLLSIPRSLILSVCVPSFCDSTILILRFRLLRFCDFKFRIRGFRSLSSLQIPTPPSFAAPDFSSRSYHPSRTSATAATRHWITMHVQMFHVKHFPLAPAARSGQRSQRNSQERLPVRHDAETIARMNVGTRAAGANTPHVNAGGLQAWTQTRTACATRSGLTRTQARGCPRSIASPHRTLLYM